MADRSDFVSESPPAFTEISRKSMENLPFSIVVADMRHDDNPLVYVNPAFEKVTGYQASAVLGRNCRFLQGSDTEKTSRNVIRDALSAGEETSVDITNYRADGEKFVNRLLLTPLHNEDGDLTHFMGIQSHRAKDAGMRHRYEELDQSMRELRHRVKNHLSMLLSLVRLQAKEVPELEGKLDVLASRVRALNLLYDDFTKTGNGSDEAVSLSAYVARVCSALNMIDGRRRVILNVDAEAIECPVDKAANVGLIVSELLTNAMQHAFQGDEPGMVQVELEATSADSECLVVVVRDDGHGLPKGCDWPNKGNLGARIVRELANRLDADLSVESNADGTTVRLEIPPAVFEH